jgi:hypothetical protein
MSEAPKIKGIIEKRLLRLEHAADLYDFPPRTLRAACLTGRVKATRIGSRWYLRPEEMERLAREGFRPTRWERG